MYLKILGITNFWGIFIDTFANKHLKYPNKSSSAVPNKRVVQMMVGWEGKPRHSNKRDVGSQISREGKLRNPFFEDEVYVRAIHS